MESHKEKHFILDVKSEEFDLISCALLECRNNCHTMANNAENDSQRAAYMRWEKMYDNVNDKIDAQAFSQAFGGTTIVARKIKMAF
ncbi:hypothetical protein [Succinivibrio dextrinosolvens]|uniref:hypothetical protein n=1 Tax=Succinivibrio dextrinosolvens TaxID=83771 RepID=UPI0019246E5F|nr:hypothetical protein [Succinivibrio dextrinosolvens]